MRLFIALELPLSIQELLVTQMNDWKAQGVTGRFCSPQNLHITLAFLAEQSKTACAQIEAILQSLPLPKLTLSLERVGFFGNLCYGALKSEELHSYVFTLRQKLKEAGIIFDAKPFKAHITLIRKVKVPESLFLHLPSRSFEVKCCTLFSSQLTPDGPIYTPLCEIFPSQ